MSDTSHFGFGKFVPGFDFLQSLAKGASSGIPQLPNLSNWVAPTLSVEELEKRIAELKAVQFWLEQNSRALTATVQALEVQKMTLATLQGMNVSMAEVANAFKPKATDTVASRTSAPAPAPAPAAAAPQPAEPVQPAAAENAQATKAPEPALVDPMQWWGALTSQFQQIAASALKDAGKPAALDPTTSMATEALKTATDMASQFAAKGLQTLRAGQRTAAGAARPTAAKKPAAKKASAPSAAKSAAKKTTARRAPRKPAGG
ncbi:MULTISPECIES: PhaM family polyhydroxyalkanoate granule multifunctional regulatory protein [Acidovorax]|uniref:PhaM family polyhydroxyalkanoate granule multifunctional regulatory protein n=1 Tax=Acidovorax TaxID=12916 RepID=UPI00258C304C|nr:PhaM family polyhydroxyalkanoate granule multifunctional regulatory protein [Acidovorax sp.]